ncbi:MAG TPA: HEAT repeat domain-containing protein [Candidatus Hydrogenedentes bacterium]|nr:HEAT repeat domain-containing protein [Candidatus Hydrogenedentota bacterium]
MRKHGVRTMALAVTCAMAVIAGTTARAQDDPVAAIASYRFGESRESLTAVEDLVRAALATPEAKQALAARLAALLESDATFDCKQFVCRQLVLLGDAAAVPALAALFADPATADMARYALERIPVPEADVALLETLPSAEGVVKIGIIASLGNRGCAAATAALADLVRNADPIIAGAAMRALGQIGGVAALQALEAIAAGTPDANAGALHDALLSCADQLLADGKKQDAIRIYNDLLDVSGRAGAAAFRGLVTALGDEGVDVVLMALKSDGEDRRDMAILLARELPGGDTTAKLAAQLSDMPPESRALMIDVLAERGGPKAREAVLRVVGSDNASMRSAAIRAMARVGTAADVMMLARLAAAGSGRERLAVRDALYALRGADVDQTVLGGLDKGEPEVRIELIRAVSERRVEAAVPKLLELATDPEAEVRAMASRALGVLARAEDLPALAGLLAAMNTDEDREAVEKAIVAATKRVPDELARNAPLLAALDGAAKEEVKASLLKILGALGDAASLPALRAAAQAEEDPVRIAAIGALADWPRVEVLEDLRVALDRETAPAPRARALRGYVRLLALPSDRPVGDTLGCFAQLLQDARNVDERKIILSGLGNVPRRGALELVMPYFDDAGLQDEAVAAALKLARPLCAAHREDIEALLDRVFAMSQESSVANQVQSIRDLIARFEDYVVAWEMSGPYFEHGKGRADLHDMAFPPEVPDATGVVWQPAPVGADADRPWLVDFARTLGGDNRVAYLRTTVIAPENVELVAEIGSDDGPKMWVNGTVVHSVDTTRGLKPGEDQFAISLNEGENTILVKVPNGGGSWAFCMRLRAADGGVVSGLGYRAE